MDKSKLISGVALAAAAATLFIGSAGVIAADQSSTVKSKCVGSNACKGHGECSSNTNACKGQNACKGTGWEMLTLKECVDKKGRA